MEADLWVHKLGMDPMTVIRKMTLGAAGVMGAAGESGSLSEGKFADPIAVRGDPLRHLDVLREARIVVAKGVHSPRPAMEPIAREMIWVNTQGVTTADLTTFSYRHRRVPLYPLEPEARW